MATETPYPDMTKLSGELYQAWESSMTQWWDQVLDSPAFLKGLGDSLSQQTQARRKYEEAMDKSMHAMHLPTRTDLTRVARIATLLEERLLGLEDKLLELEDKMLEVEKETLRARVDAAEARVAVDEKLASIEAKLDALVASQQALVEAQTKPKRASRARKTPAKKPAAKAADEES